MFSRTYTLTANAVTTVTMDKDYDKVEVLSRDGAAEVWYSVDGTTPTVEGDNLLLVVAAINGQSEVIAGGDVTVVKLISSGTPKVYVRGS